MYALFQTLGKDRKNYNLLWQTGSQSKQVPPTFKATNSCPPTTLPKTSKQSGSWAQASPPATHSLAACRSALQVPKENGLRSRDPMRLALNRHQRGRGEGKGKRTEIYDTLHLLRASLSRPHSHLWSHTLNHEYSTASFITDKTLDDFYTLNADEDHSTEVYVATGTVLLEETAYYTNIKLQTPNGSKLTLYSSSANQYNWLKAYAGQEITVEIVPCNWNGKSYYAGCVIAVRTADGKILNELNFTTK